MKKRAPKVSAFAQMLRDKREKLAPDLPLREFCASRGFDVPTIADMEADRRTAPATYAALYKLAGGYGHEPGDRWTRHLLEAAVGAKPSPAKRAAVVKPALGARGGQSASHRAGRGDRRR
jgi:hypothetical protein